MENKRTQEGLSAESTGRSSTSEEGILTLRPSEGSRFGGRGCLDLLCPRPGGAGCGSPQGEEKGGQSTAFRQSRLGLRAALGLGLCDPGQIPSPLSGPQSPH